MAKLQICFCRACRTILSKQRDHRLKLYDPNWFSDPRDQEVGVAGYKRARAVFATNAVKGVVLSPKAYPSANVTTDQDILETLRNSASSVFRGAGINAMGKASDPMTVVDTKFRVFVVQGLRVVDASCLSHFAARVSPGNSL